MHKFNIEAEKAVIASCLDNNNIICDILMIVNYECFYWDSHRNMFKIIENLYNKNLAVDALILNNELAKNKGLNEIDSGNIQAEIKCLLNCCTTVAHSKYYAGIVKELYLKRKFSDKIIKIQNKIFSDSDLVDLFSELEEELDNDLNNNSGLKNVDEMNILTCENYDKRKNGLIESIPTDFATLDECLSGYEAGSLNVVAAESKIGKTTFALNVTLNCLRRGKNVVYYSLEMSSVELMNKLIANYANLCSWKIKKNLLNDDDELFYYKKLADFRKYKLLINDSSELRVSDMRNELKGYSKKNKIDLVVIDYLQLLTPSNEKDSPNIQISKITRQLKIMAGVLKVPIVILSQLNRGNTYEHKKPTLKRLRDSGSIEQDADSVLFLHRELNEKVKTSIIIAKNRSGREDEIELNFNGDYQRFED